MNVSVNFIDKMRLLSTLKSEKFWPETLMTMALYGRIILTSQKAVEAENFEKIVEFITNFFFTLNLDFNVWIIDRVCFSDMIYVK